MDAQGIRIVGPGGARYQPGQPMRMFAGSVFLGQVEPVELRNGGLELHFGSFTPADIVQHDPRNVGAFLFYEACAHIARFHPQVQLITFASSRPMPLLGDPARQAAARVATALRIGAMDVRVTPAQSGLIVVSGSWAYNERNLRELELALEEQRAIYRAAAIGSRAERPRWYQRLGRVLFRVSRA